MTPVVLLVLALAAPTVPLVSVSMETAPDGRSAVVVRLPTAQAPAVTRREGTRLIVALPGGATIPLAVPAPRPPVLSMALERPSAGGDRLVLQLSGPWDFEEQRAGRELRLVFASRLSADDVEVLAEMLFPIASRKAEPDLASNGTRQVARVGLRPTVGLTYASGNNAFDAGPQPQQDSYFEAIPRLEAWGGPFRASYEAYLRRGSRYDTANTLTQSLAARFDHRLASEAHLSGRYTFLDGRQQAVEVDPGGEYFYGYEPFRKQQAGTEMLVPIGGYTSILFGGTWNDVRFDRPGTFMDYSTWDAHGGLRRDLGGQTNVEVQYLHGQVYDSSDANVQDTTSDAVALSLTSELRPSLNVHLMAGVRRADSPGAPSSARTLTDFVGRADVRRQFGDSTAVGLSYERTRTLSAFENNPSYLSNLVGVTGNAPLPWLISLAASFDYRRNSYPLPASGLGLPRRDDLYTWRVGIGRSLGSRLVGHVEYDWSHRDSNVPRLTSSTHAIVVQLDVDPFRKGSGQ